jgi:hypothetical protein
VNKQLVNLIGAAASLAILLLGVLVCALPMFSSANATMSNADDVAQQNQTQQSILDGLTSQAGQLPDIQQDVSELRREIPASERLEDVVELATDAAAAHGGAVQAVTRGESAAFAQRTMEVVTAEVSTDGGAAGLPAPAPSSTPAPAEEDAEAEPAPAPAEPAPVDPEGPQQLEVTVEIKAPTVDAATLILDALRSGPRLVAVTQASVLTEEEAVTLTATILVFTRP